MFVGNNPTSNKSTAQAQDFDSVPTSRQRVDPKISNQPDYEPQDVHQKVQTQPPSHTQERYAPVVRVRLSLVRLGRNLLEIISLPSHYKQLQHNQHMQPSRCMIIILSVLLLPSCAPIEI